MAFAPRPGGDEERGPDAPASGSGSGALAAAESNRPAGTVLLGGGPVPPAAAPEAMLGVAALDGGHLVAVGSAAGGRPAVWESLDAGASWAVTWSGPERVNGAQGAAVGVARGPGGLVAVGWEGVEDDAASGTHAAVWQSPGGDPASWEPAPAAGLEGAAALHDVMADGGGLVAAGRDLSDDAADGDGGIWRSDDGASWRRVATAGLGGPGRQELHRLVRLADGRWLALGRQMRGARMTPAVWTSADLSSWTEADGRPSGSGGVPSVWGLAVLDDGTVAVGADGEAAAGWPVQIAR